MKVDHLIRWSVYRERVNMDNSRHLLLTDDPYYVCDRLHRLRATILKGSHTHAVFRWEVPVMPTDIVALDATMSVGDAVAYDVEAMEIHVHDIRLMDMTPDKWKGRAFDTVIICVSDNVPYLRSDEVSYLLLLDLLTRGDSRRLIS